MPCLGPSAGATLAHTTNNNMKDQEDKPEMFSLQRKYLICSTALYRSFHTKGKISLGSTGLSNVVTLPCSLPLSAATAGSLEQSTGNFFNVLEILVEHFFNNYQIAPLPPASPCMCSLPPELGWGVELLEPLGKKKQARDEPLLSPSGKGIFIAKQVAWQSKIWYAERC